MANYNYEVASAPASPSSGRADIEGLVKTRETTEQKTTTRSLQYAPATFGCGPCSFTFMNKL
ncbi:hypothetical protein GOP47_0001359 [Adiantum capillus-veneris]|uniref:Uncharacterized protein n=1 Tax=Adiantum capillus-veneris TaxID=13818 RepID=A0A9D4V839_ADICA|nr:hypothetical protein GOP47_0001359 [Adiantum capillus-veneris]